jgi:DNA-binding NarL/FixJ family response regulator
MIDMLQLGLVNRHEIYRTLLKNYLEQTGSYKVVLDASEECTFIEDLNRMKIKPDVLLLDYCRIIQCAYREVIEMQEPRYQNYFVSQLAQSNQIDPAIPAQTDPHFCWRKIA